LHGGDGAATRERTWARQPPELGIRYDGEVRGRDLLGPVLASLAVGLAVAVTEPAPLAAQAGGGGAAGADSAEEKRRRASRHVEEGDRYKEAGQYDRAAREYEKAYELVPHAVLIFNLGQVTRLGGEKRRALEYYERYLAAEPDGRASEQARSFVAELKREIRAEERKGRGGDGRAGSGAKDGSGAGPDSGGGSGVDVGGGGAGGGAADIGAGLRPGPPGRGMRIGGMAAAGAGAVSLGVGVVFGMKARSISDEISTHDDAWTDEILARQDEGRRAERVMLVATGLGVAAVAAGAVLYYLGHSAESGGRLEASAMVTGDSFGLVVGGRF
jgi:tetratricopeptide (TPR) repeat protein